MVVSGVLCLTLILIGLSQIEAHELYLPSKKIGLKFRKVEVPGIQECIEACNLDRKCESLAMNGHAQCFIEDPTGNVGNQGIRSIPDAVIMVKSSINKCRENIVPVTSSPWVWLEDVTIPYWTRNWIGKMQKPLVRNLTGKLISSALTIWR